MTIVNSNQTPAVRQRSRAKIWLRTGILTIFAALFGLSLYRDVAAGSFAWYWSLAVFVVCLPIGFGLRKLVPMQVHLTSKHITLSFDRFYFALIFILVVGKAITGQWLHLAVWPDVIMCAILGLMTGRLSGICVRVRHLKVQYRFLPEADDRAF